jgi:hypothetical protein
VIDEGRLNAELKLRLAPTSVLGVVSTISAAHYGCKIPPRLAYFLAWVVPVWPPGLGVSNSLFFGRSSPHRTSALPQADGWARPRTTNPLIGCALFFAQRSCCCLF